MATLPRRIALALVGAASLLGCHSPSEDYDRFVAATDEARKEALPIASSHFEDVSGKWLVSSLLAGGLALGLRMRFALDQAKTPVALTADIWLAAADTNLDPPLLTVQTVIDDTGRFELQAVPLVLKQGSVKGLNVDVVANVIMDCYTQSIDEWCGGATGMVTDPLQLDLHGSTLGAARDEAGTKLIADVPSRCPPAKP